MAKEVSREPARAWLSPEALLGRTIEGRYRLQQVVGSGGYGVVFAALDEHTGKRVALKLCRSLERGVNAFRVLQEAHVTAALRHPNIVALHDWGEYEGQLPFLVFELLTGHTLEAERANGALEPARALSLLLPIMGAVAYAHDRGVLHRDLKTENIFLARDASGVVTPKLLDFGVAKTAEASLTRSGSILGTPAFMSPEQALAEPLDARSDVWSMGVVLFACLTGQLPFAGDSHTRTLLELVSAPAPALDGTALPPRLCAAVERALERRRERRHADMRAFAHALKVAALEDGIALPEAPDPVGLHAWPSWLPHETPSELDFEITHCARSVVGRYKECMIAFWRCPPTPDTISALNELAKRMRARFGQFSFLTVVEGDAGLPNAEALSDILRFYDDFPLRCAANVSLARGATGETHHAVAATIEALRRRSYPSRVFSETATAIAWIAKQSASAEHEQAFEEGLTHALAQIIAAEP